MENNTHFSRLIMSKNPLESKMVRCIIEGKHPGSAVEECIDELTSNIEINILDIPAWIMALEVIRTSLNSHIEEDKSAQRIVELLREDSQVITYTVKKQQDHNHKEDENNEPI